MIGVIRRQARIATVVAAFIGCVAAPAAHAQSSYEDLGTSHGITYATDFFNIPSASEDHLAVPCPKESQSYFTGGAELFGGPEATYLSGMSGQLGDGWDTRAYDNFDLGGSAVQAFSLCAKFRLGDYSSNSTDHGVPAGPATEKEFTKCDDGKLLGGGGFFAGNNAGEWYLNSSYPKGNGWAWEGYHFEFTSESEIIGEVNCEVGAKKPDIVEKSVKSGKEHVKAKVFCKKGVVTGGGGSASKDASLSHLVITKPIDGKDKKSVPDDGWAIEYENDGIVKQTFTVYAVCH